MSTKAFFPSFSENAHLGALMSALEVQGIFSGDALVAMMWNICRSNS